jgi:hypothetical protein
MTDGYWVVSVERASGRATTSPLFSDKDEAYRYALDTETPEACTTVVARRTANSRGILVNRC